MQPTTALPLFSAIMVLLGGLGAAAPVADGASTCQPQTICIDAINTCGVRYGGCYDVCKTASKPQPPPCPSTIPATTKRTSTKKPTSTKKTSSKKPTSTKKSSSTKPTPTSTKPVITTKVTQLPPATTGKATGTSSCTAAQTVCLDGINECGQWYGGCFPDCRPWPTFTAPPCSKTVTKTTITTRVVTSVRGPPILTLPQ
ncbi:hypothetical protein N656DRAFT_765273 [Canariomyces notabilis]|uniref:CBM1 domain-containing protein n=1 Tax=Canariomyces notabilis TaxID=2074819 RepID=A0AAN6TKW5_9PEZI|nr:hypothetical protein N656DRAFT_765273 [Canariomyces arenarius]